MILQIGGGWAAESLLAANCQLNVANAVGGLLDTQHGAHGLSASAGQAAANTAAHGKPGSGSSDNPACAFTFADLAAKLQAIADMAAALEIAAGAIRNALEAVDCNGVAAGGAGAIALHDLMNQAAAIAKRLQELTDQYNALVAQVLALIEFCTRRRRGNVAIAI